MWFGGICLEVRRSVWTLVQLKDARLPVTKEPFFVASSR